MSVFEYRLPVHPTIGKAKKVVGKNKTVFICKNMAGPAAWDTYNFFNEFQLYNHEHNADVEFYEVYVYDADHDEYFKIEHSDKNKDLRNKVSEVSKEKLCNDVGCDETELYF